MGHKKRYQKKHTSSPAKNQNNQQNYPKATEEQLTIECLQIHQIFKNRHKLIKQQKLDYCYLLSTKWLQDWKQYVGYYQLTSDNQQNNNKKKKGKKHPGKINYELTVGNHKYYDIPQTMPDYQYLNIVLGQKLQKDDDYIAISKQLWDIFASKYDSVQIKRPKRVTKKGSVVYDGGLINLDIIFVDYGNDQLLKSIQNMKTKKANLDQEFPCKKMQLSQLWELQQLMQFLSEYSQNIYQSKQIKLWKGETYITSGSLQKQIWDGLHQNHQKFLITARVLQGQKYDDLDLDQFLRNYYTLIVQINGNRFITKKTQQNIKGYCEQCVQNKELTLRCECDTVFYCSNECRITDQCYHFKICKEAFDSQDDQVYNDKKMTIHKDGFPICGLNNLGNTCYMNSVIQSLMSIDEVIQYFLVNGFIDQIDQKQQKQNKGSLLYKYSKMCKQLTQSKSTYSPWSIKGQINYFLSPFKGFKQHDANDLLVNFINTINQQLKKTEGKVYHKLFQQNFIGTFHSQIKCPDCTINIKNQEIFSQITLPLKPKAKTTTATYVIYQSAYSHIKGKCNLYESWYQIRKSLGLEETCLLMASREGEHAIQIDEEQQPEKTMRKVKRQLVFYPNSESEGEGQVIFSFVLITQKIICGQKMKSPYSYPAVISAVPILHTIGTFIIKIIKEFCPKQVYEQAQKIKEECMKQMQNSSKQSVSSQGSTQISKEDIQKAKQQQERKYVDLVNKKLQSLLQKHKIHILINDNKRHRNLCHFCKKKCNGCELLPDFSVNLTLYLEGKLGDVNFEVLLSEKLEVVVQTVDIAKSGYPILQQCFQLFNQPEQLDEQNAWYCQACDMMRLAYKQLSVAQLPKVLIIHLNRFKAQNHKRVKNSDPIQYKQIQELCGRKYKLLSAIIHQGSTQGGHYWAICYRNDRYYIFNDSKVSETKNICNKNAYVLIYRAIDIK